MPTTKKKERAEGTESLVMSEATPPQIKMLIEAVTALRSDVADLRSRIEDHERDREIHHRHKHG